MTFDEIIVFFSYFGMLYSTYYFHVLSVHSPVHPSRLSYYLSCLLFVLHFWITMFLWQIKRFAIHKHFQFWMTIFCVHLSDFSHLLWLLFGTFLLLLFELLYLIFIFQFSTLTFKVVIVTTSIYLWMQLRCNLYL